jgi:hypothetical protein
MRIASDSSTSFRRWVRVPRSRAIRDMRGTYGLARSTLPPPSLSRSEPGRGLGYGGASRRVRRMASSAGGLADSARIRPPRRPARRPAGRLGISAFRASGSRQSPLGAGRRGRQGAGLIHANAIESFQRTNTPLPIRLKLIVEGEEEVGSPNLDNLLREHADSLSTDFVCVSDTAMFGRGLAFALRRLARSRLPRSFRRGSGARSSLWVLRGRRHESRPGARPNACSAARRAGSG